MHPAMWDMLLSFGRAYPEAWAAINMRKVVLPRLMALLRYAATPLILHVNGHKISEPSHHQLSSAGSCPCSSGNALQRGLSSHMT